VHSAPSPPPQAQQGTAKLNQHHELEMLTNTFTAAAAPTEERAFVVREDEEEVRRGQGGLAVLRTCTKQHRGKL
jgi:hypothetical protein